MHRRHSRAFDLLAYLLGVTLLAWAITTAWLAMRAVMDIGGMCAEGGPYVIETPCPDGVPLLLFLAFPGGFLAAGMMLRWGSRLGSGWAGLVALAWPALFLSLGWNFLEYGVGSPGGLELGWLIPGVLFVLMGGVPLVIGLRAAWGMRRTRKSQAGQTTSAGSSTSRGSSTHPASGTPSPKPAARPAPTTGPPVSPASPSSRVSDDPRVSASGSAIEDARAELASALRAAAGAAGIAAADQVTVAETLRDVPDPSEPPTEAPDTSLVEQLERLAALKRDGALGELEYLQAKQAVIAAATRGDIA